MKKYITIALMAVSCLAVAKGSSHPKAGEMMVDSGVDFAKTPRVLHFNWLNNDISTEGQILVCARSNPITSWKDEGKCGKDGKNAWMLAETSLPGWVMKRYEYRLVGSSGARELILYFGK